jgi:hypothetical protein
MSGEKFKQKRLLLGWGLEEHLNGPTVRMQVNVLTTGPYDPESDRR